MTKKYLKIVLKATVSLAFLFWVVYKVNWSSVLSDVAKVDFFYLVLYTLVVLLGMIICAYKWKILANFKGINLSLGDFFKLYLTGTFINNFMPSFIGGDTFKAYETGKTDGRYIEAASSVTMDRITGLLGATILALVFSLFNFSRVFSNPILFTVNIIILFSLSFDVFIAKIRHHSFWSRLGKFFPEKFVDFIIDLGTYNSNSKILQKTIILAIIFDFLGIALANYILFLALGVRIGILDYLSVVFLISIISSVPISVNNIGIKEWAYITFFGVFGLSSSSVITVAIVSRFVQMFISFFALPIYLKARRTKPIAVYSGMQE